MAAPILPNVTSYATLAALEADSPPDGTMAVVYADPTPTNNRSYVRQGGAWVTDYDPIAYALGNRFGFQQAGTGSVLRTFQSKVQDFVSVLDKDADPTGTIDSTAAFNNALATGKKVFVPAGTYLLNLSNLPNNAYLYGEGWNTILKPLTDTQSGAIMNNSGSPTSFITGVTIRDLQFQSDVATAGFSQFAHLLTLNGVQDWLIDNVLFYGFRGDGLYIGSGDVGGNQMHNVNVRVLNCTFDGVNNENRNGISIVDGTNILIGGCTFRNCTENSMPGAIDVEPDTNTWHVLQNIIVRDCFFTNVGGNYGCISINLHDYGTLTTPPQHFVFENNSITNYVGLGTGGAFFVDTNSTTALTNSSTTLDVQIRNNYVAMGSNGRNLQLIGVRDVKIIGNTFIGGLNASLLSYSGTGQNSLDVVFKDNKLFSHPPVTAYSVQRLLIDNNIWIDGTTTTAYQFNSGSSSYVSLTNNIVTVISSSMTLAVQNVGHTFTVSTNAFYGNNFNGLTNGFVWNKVSNSIPTVTADCISWTPALSGRTSAGTGTYTTQNGSYSVNGHVCTFQANVLVSAHTGTGQLLMSLPVSPSPTKNLQDNPVTVTLANSTVPAGSNVLAEIDLTMNQVWFYTEAAGALTQFPVPASSSLNLRVSGTYYVD